MTPAYELMACKRIEQLASEVLEEADTTRKEAECTLGEPLSPYEVRFRFDKFEGELHPAMIDTFQRFIFVNNSQPDHEGHGILGAPPEFSMEIGALEEGRYRGYDNESAELEFFLANEAAKGKSELWRVINNAFKVARELQSGDIPEEDDINQVIDFFDRSISGDKSTTTLTRQVRTDVKSGQLYLMQRQHSEEDCPDRINPLFSVRLRKSNEALVLEKDNKGQFETHTENPDRKKVQFSYADPETIVANDAGEPVMGVVRRGAREAVHEAERALGVRGLHKPILDEIETALLQAT